MVSALHKELIEAKQNSNKDMMQIITKFMPLIKKYSRKLPYYEIETDLIITIIKAINSYPISENEEDEKIIVSYLAQSIKHEYIRLSKKNSKIILLEVDLDDTLYLIKSNDNVEETVIVNIILDELPDKQRILMKELFIDGYSEAYLAERHHVSRQAINKTKRKALENIRKCIA